MRLAQKWIAAAFLPVAGGVVLALSGVGVHGAAGAPVPVGPPVFQDPTVFSNPFFPFQAGGSRISVGRADGRATVILDSFLAETRDFPFGGGTVTCRVLVETNFEGGRLIENTRNYFATADDGSVYYFGETVDTYEFGAITGHGGSWLVGGGSGEDPAETVTVTDPGLFMPAVPVAGDQYMPENVPAGPQELDAVRAVQRTVKVPAGAFAGCIEVLEHDLVDDDFETKWYAPGIGVVRGKAKGETFALVATTFLPPTSK